MKRIYLYGILVVVILGTGGYFLLSKGSAGDLKYRTDKVSRGNVVVQVRATGTLNPPLTIEIGSQVSGTIAKLFADYNTEVKKGQIVAIIDSTFLYAAVQQAEANVEKNQADLNQAKRSLDREQDLFNKSLVSQADLDAALATDESDLAQVKQSKAALYQTQVNLHFAVIRAPSDGVIIERDVEVGQTVAASLQAPKLFSLATDLKNMQVEASVDEADIGQIKDDQSVTFTVDAYPEQTFTGTVTQVRLDPIITQNVVTYTVIIAVANPDLKLRPGMTATVSILVDRRENVLRVPTLATRFQPPADALDKTTDQSMNQQSPQGNQPQQDAKMKWRQRNDSSGTGQHTANTLPGDKPVMKNGRIWVLDVNRNLKPIQLKVGLNDNRYVEISSDILKEGDDIVIGVIASDMASASGNQTNPFQPRMGGGGGGGKRGP
jgi:HlyD family secretion protein